MRTHCVEVYEFHELGPDAQQIAMDKMRDLIALDESSFWAAEHFESMNCALKAFRETRAEDLSGLIPRFESAKATGYCADAIMADLIKEHGEDLSGGIIEDRYRQEWENECLSRLEDDYVRQECEIREYYSNGNLF